MKNWLQHIFFNNSLQAWLTVGVILFIAAIFKRRISRQLAAWFYTHLIKSRYDVNRNAFIDLVVIPLERFILLFVAIAAFNKLNFPSILQFDIFNVTTQEALTSLAIALLIIAFLVLLLRLIDFTALVLEHKANLTSDQTDNQLIVFFKDFFKVLLSIIGFLMILRFAFHQNIDKLLTGLSIVGAAIALALRESLENLIASFIIFFDKPFTSGDVVKVQNITGTIERIGLRSTRIRTADKTYVSVPNKQMVDTVLDNISLRTERRFEVKIELHPATTLHQLEILLQHARQTIRQLPVAGSKAYYQEVSAQGPVLWMEVFTSATEPFEQFLSTRENINLSLLKCMEENSIKMASEKDRNL